MGLYVLHSDHNITHKDLKPANVMVKDGIFKIGDFGLANKNEKIHDWGGSPPYMAPEQYEITQAGYTNKVDVWAFGVIMYLLLFNSHPFMGERGFEVERMLKI